MSLNDRRKSNMPELPEGNAISRSKSFAGFLNRSLSKKESTRTTDIIGHDYRVLVQRATDRHPKTTKMPKTPRPLRALVIIDSVRSGLRECIALTTEDIGGLTAGVERLSIQNSQLKAAECYLKRLELQLNRLEDLSESYNVQYKIREGIRNMAQAYVNSLGKERDSALGKVKAGYKECTQSMCSLEAQLEQMMGSIELKMRGIAGFARLCPGDVFQIIIHHGTQKWKSRGLVNKDASQSWDHETMVLKCMIGDILHVKASEVRTLGNRLIVGNKLCETKDLFSAHPQMMTISLNSNGSLKLNLVITWNPLDGLTDEALWSPWMLKPANAVPKLCRNSSSTMRSDEATHERSINRAPAIKEEETETSRPDQHSDAAISFGSEHRSPSPPKNDRSSGGSMSPSDFSGSTGLGSMEDIIRAVIASVENVVELKEHPQLQKMEELVHTLEKLLMPWECKDGRLSRGSDLSISVESALDCFDFLNEVEDDPSERKSRSQLDGEIGNAMSKSRGPKREGRDCSVDSLDTAAFRNSDRTVVESRQVSSGNEQIDMALMQHLLYCDSLLELLGSYGPLKHGESRATRHLIVQTDILKILVRLVREPALLEDFTTIMRDITEKQRLHLLWEQCAGGHYLNTSADSVVTQLKARYVHFLKKFSETEKQDVLELLVCQILDRSSYAPSAIITVFHFLFFFKADGHWEVEALLQRFYDDLSTLAKLQSVNVSEVVDTLRSLRGRPVDAAYAVQIGVCLLSKVDEIHSAAREFLTASSNDETLRTWMIRTYATALEDDRADIRRAACRALCCLHAVECARELAYVMELDPSPVVKAEAQESLAYFGEEGLDYWTKTRNESPAMEMQI